jgi:glycine oxidase
VSVNTDVLIIGGGVVGSAIAREMARNGRKVTVVEAGGYEGAGWQAAAGLLAPQIEAHIDDPMLEVGLAGREYYSNQAAELEETSGIPIGLSLGGILQLASTEAEADRLRAHFACQRQQGLFCDWLLPDEVHNQWPWLGPTFGGLWAPEDGCLDPSGLVHALIVDGNRLGVRRVEDRIESLEVVSGRVLAARGKGRYAADDVIIAAGAWSGRLAGLPRPVSVEPVRGQMLAIQRPRSLPDVVLYGYGHYLLTRGDEVLAGATMEHVGFSAETTEEGIEHIRQAADRLCPPVIGTQVARSWAGLRPGTPDGLPILGPEPRAKGLWYATGHGRNGVLLAGISGVILQQMMAGEATLESVKAFRPDRFWSW